MKSLVILITMCLVLLGAQSLSLSEELLDLEQVLEKERALDDKAGTDIDEVPDIDGVADKDGVSNNEGFVKTNAVADIDGLTSIDELLDIKPFPLARNPNTCCHPGITYVDLQKGSVCDISNRAVQVIEGPKAGPYDVSCSMQALLKINFQKLTSSPCGLVDGCVYGPYCGRRMLRIDLELSPGARRGYMFNVGDSVSNDAWGGDANDQKNDAEVHGTHPNIYVYSNDDCKKRLATHIDAVRAGLVSHVTLYVSDKHVRITNDNGLDETLCHKCLFALNGQPDSGGVNQDIYLGLNRVVDSQSNRFGYGVCKARLSWMCPW